jgi:hypothetical protein
MPIKPIEYMKERYAEEQSRFSHFETKSAAQLRFLSGAIGAITIIGGYIGIVLYHPVTELDWCRSIVFTLSLFCAVCAWGHALQAIKVGNCPVLPKSREVAVYLKDINVNDTDREEFILNCHVDTIEQLKKTIDEKSINIEHAHEELTFSAWGVALLAILTVIIEATK